MARLQHLLERLHLRALGIREKRGNPGERLVGARVEHVQDRTAQETVSRGLPMIFAVLFAGGIDEDVRDVLGVLDLAEALANLQKSQNTKVFRRGRPLRSVAAR